MGSGVNKKDEGDWGGIVFGRGRVSGRLGSSFSLYAFKHCIWSENKDIPLLN
jgi:hypothetical protein